MHYFLRQVVPPDCDTRPIEIVLVGVEVPVGKETNQLLMNFPSVSRKHAKFYVRDDGTVLVRDEGSKNGLYVNDVRVGKGWKLLAVGDTIGFGACSENIGRGFLCVFCAQSSPDVIDLASEDEPMPDVISDDFRTTECDSRDTVVQNPLPVTSPVQRNTSSSTSSVHRDYGSSCNIAGREVQPQKSRKRDPECLQTRHCVVKIVKCDSEDFEWPSDVRRTSLQPIVRRRKRISRLSSSDSSGEENANGFPNRRRSLSKVLSSDSSENEGTSRQYRVLKQIENKKAFASRRKERTIISSPGYPKGSPIERRKKRPKVLSSDSSDENSTEELPRESTCVKKKSAPKQMENEELFVKAKKSSRKLSSDSPEENFLPVIPKNTSTDKGDLKITPVSSQNYSIQEECIYISDDETYLKLDTPMDYDFIKQEPEEIDDFDNDIYNEIFGSDNLESQRLTFTSTDYENEPMESIEKIREFVGYTDETHCSENDFHSSHESSSALRNAELPSTSHEKSVDYYDTEPSYGNDELMDSDEQSVGNDPPPAENRSSSDMTIRDSILKNQNKSKTLFTDPKPMRPRPRRLMGRDEDFVERRKGPVPSLSPEERIERRRQFQDNQESNIRNPKVPILHKSSYKEDSINKIDSSRYPNRSRASRSNTYAETSKKRAFCGEPTEDNQQSERRNTEKSNTIKHSSNTEKSSQQKTDKSNFARVKNRASLAFVDETKQNGPKKTSSSSSHSNDIKSSKMQTSKNASVPPHDLTDYTRNTNLRGREFSFGSLVKSILMFNTIWLKEQMDQQNAEQQKVDPPPDVKKGAAILPLSFEDYPSYVKSFYPMIILEIWDYMVMESREVLNSDRQYQKFYFSLLSYTHHKDYVELKCESVIGNTGFQPRDGMVAIFELKEVSKKCNFLFGYIVRHEVKELKLRSLKSRDWEQITDNFLNDAKHWTYRVWIKPKIMSYDMNSLMRGNGICYIRNKLRLADALDHLKKSPLMQKILKPDFSTFAVQCIPKPARGLYSNRQMEIIEGMSAEISKPQAKIMLLQGPPGSGKTHVIIGVLEKIFCSTSFNSDFKVLVTAPSNASVDEIGTRLVKLNESLAKRNGNTIKFVRMGVEKQVNHKVMPHFIDRQIRDLGRKRGVAKMDDHTEKKFRKQVLKESHVVLSTSSSCGNFLKSDSDMRFVCCFVDDSTQCTELQILEPLKLGVNKLVLTGDYQEIPPSVYSKVSQSCQLYRTAFERFDTYFRVVVKKNPTLTLTEQFRMHSSICRFPSEFLYENKLSTDPDLDAKYDRFPLQPYIVLDIPEPAEACRSPVTDIVFEVNKFLSKVAKYCRLFRELMTTAVIVAHDSQRDLYSRMPRSRYMDAEVGTVSKFQGREFDATILCAFKKRGSDLCDSPNLTNCKRRLNVALTRSRMCLVVCMHSSELMQEMPPPALLDGDYSTHSCGKMWQKLIQDAKKRKVFFTVSSATDTYRVLRRCSK